MEKITYELVDSRLILYIPAVVVDLALLVVRAAIVADRGECEETELLGAAPVFKNMTHFQKLKQNSEYLNPEMLLHDYRKKLL